MTKRPGSSLDILSHHGAEERKRVCLYDSSNETKIDVLEYCVEITRDKLTTVGDDNGMQEHDECLAKADVDSVCATVSGHKQLLRCECHADMDSEALCDVTEAASTSNQFITAGSAEKPDTSYCKGVMGELYMLTPILIFPLESFHTENLFCLLYTSPSPRDATLSRMPSSA